MVKLILLLLVSSIAFSRQLERQVYIGGRAGHVSMTESAKGNYGDAVGYGLDFGLKDLFRNIDAYYNWQLSPHGGPGNLSVQAHSFAFEFHPLDLVDMDVTLGIGPGFYLFKRETGTEGRFGLGVGASAALILKEHLILGILSKYHLIKESPISGNFWTFMAKIGYAFSV